jgi:hypothetical protein
MERVNMPSQLRNWKFLRFCKQGNKQGNKQESLASGHKSGGLVSVLASGLSTHPQECQGPNTYYLKISSATLISSSSLNLSTHELSGHEENADRFFAESE